MTVDVDPFDFDSAVLRRSEADLRAFMAALAVRLEGALPNRVEVTRRRDGLFAKETHVAKIVLHGEGGNFEVRLEHGHVTASKAKVVRGVVISAGELPLSDWLAALRADVRGLAQGADASAGALHDFL